MHPLETHWAETDGESVWLSSTRKFDDDTLYYTLLHEELHGMIRRVGRDGTESELSEACEHRIMHLMDHKLV